MLMPNGESVSARTNAYRMHPLRDALGALGTLSPASRMAVEAASQAFLQRAAQLAAGVDVMPLAAAPGRIDGRPALWAPHPSGAACLSELVGKLMYVLGEGSVQRLRQSAAVWNSLSQAQRESLDALSDQYKRAIDDAGAATDAAEQAQAAAKAAGERAEVSERAAEAAQRAYERAVVEGLPREQIDALWKIAEQTRQKAADQHHDATGLQDVAARKAQAAIEMAGGADRIEKQLDSAAHAVAVRSHVHVGQTRADNGAAELTIILARLQQLIATSSLAELDTRRETLNEIQEKRQADLTKKSEEYQKQVQRAEDLSKTMGCVGKIVGWTVTAVSFAAAAFTGGASLALAAVGLALTAADQIGESVTGVSFMQSALEGIMKPMMNGVASLAKNLLVAAGVDPQQAELIGAITAAVVTGVVFIVGAFAAMSLAKTVASKVTEVVAQQVPKLAESAIGKVTIAIAESVAQRTGLQSLGEQTSVVMARLRRALGVELEAMQGTMNQIAKLGLVAGTTNQLVQAGGGVVVGVQNRDAMLILAETKEARYDVNQIGALLKQNVEAFTERTKALTGMMQDMSDAAATEMATGLAVMRQLRTI
ncbi:type III secretion system translocon subunit SctE [Burkholderia dolosa]|uniref:type III secretion system translocon subunit SctE n=1 Tax=Burkholderia dolosa TaxID=152500 RepID=UPI001591C05C|nr:type III secretion system translocon subunit SctE [Burkholderia dolosa]MBR8458402.1 type III secretion system translocon subunit SctE [Burkholderia dolosa]